MILPEDLAKLSREEKREALERLLRERRARTGIQDPALPEYPPPRPERLPLSSAQRRIWMACTMSEETSLYAVQAVLRHRGTLDLSLAASCLDKLIERHEILRTGYLSTEDGIVQIIHPPAPCPIVFHGLEETSTPEQINEIIRQDLCRPFDMKHGPMLRACIAELGGGAHLLILTLHHIAVDGWSLGNLLKEFAECYTVRAKGETPDNPPAAWQYADYALWEQRQEETASCARALDYWAESLRGMPETILLMKGQATDTPCWKGAEATLDIPAELTCSLRELGRNKGMTLFSVTLTGFLAVLQRYAQMDDVVVGTPVANRVRRRFEDMCGCFVNMVPIRPCLDSGATFEEALVQVRDAVHGALAHAEVPFEKIVDHLQANRRPGAHPLFQTVFAFHEAPRALFPFGDGTAGIEPPPVFTTRFDVELHVYDTGTGLKAHLIFARDLFDIPLMQMLLRAWRVSLQCAVASPGTVLHDLDLWEAGDISGFLRTVNNTASAYPRDCAVQDLVDAWAERKPGEVALVEGDIRITYHEMKRRAGLLARKLVLDGVHAEDIVAVNLPRSADCILCLLAVLEAGGVYLPLDPESPSGRWREVLEQSGAKFLIANEPDTDKLKTVEGLTVIPFGKDYGSEPKIPLENTVTGNRGRAPAYVIFTSGSTGEPKGVCIEHRSIARLVRQTNYISISPHDVVAHASSPAFDAATFEIWGALANGARLVIIKKHELLDASLLKALLLREQITVMLMTTALFNHYARTNPGIFASLRVLLFGGENSDPVSVAAVRRNCTDTTLIHVYGPTESTTLATYHIVQEVPARAKTIPIGLPVSNTTVYVLDTNRRCVPPGVPGELYLGGDGLARGYLNRQARTDEVFIPNPLPGNTDARLYRTGDRVIQRAEGAIEFIGRVDRQVKIRGYRVEPGEVEQALRRHPAVLDAVATVRKENGENVLVAYVVPRSEKPVGEEELLQYLRRQLPSYMMPHAWAMLKTLPLNANGKVDFGALPAPVTRAGPAMTSEPPRTGTERLLMRMWSEMTGVPVTHRHQNFFDAGGHSLLALSLLERIRTEFKVDIPFTTFLVNPSVSALAAAIEDRRASGSPGMLQLKESLVPIQPEGSRPPLFCCWPAGGAVFMYYPLAEYLGPEQPLYALQDPALDPSRNPFRSMKDIAAEAVETIRRVQPQGPYHLCGWCFGGTLAYEMACQLTAAGESVRRLILMDSHAVFEGGSLRRNWGAILSRLVRYLFIGLSLVPATVSFIADGVGLIAIAPHASKGRWVEYVRARYAALMLHRIGAVAVASKNDILRSMELPAVRRIFYLYYAHELAYRSYQPGRYEGTVDLLRATELSRFFPTRNDPTLGWSRYAGGVVHVLPIHSNHSQLLGPRGIGQVAAHVARLLETHD